MQGDATLYARGDTVEKAWEYVQPILNAWKNNPNIPIYGYPAGTWGWNRRWINGKRAMAIPMQGILIMTENIVNFNKNMK